LRLSSVSGDELVCCVDGVVVPSAEVGYAFEVSAAPPMRLPPLDPGGEPSAESYLVNELDLAPSYRSNQGEEAYPTLIGVDLREARSSATICSSFIGVRSSGGVGRQMETGGAVLWKPPGKVRKAARGPYVSTFERGRRSCCDVNFLGSSYPFMVARLRVGAPRQSGLIR
jgi:hypothetical protein